MRTYFVPVVLGIAVPAVVLPGMLRSGAAISQDVGFGEDSVSRALSLTLDNSVALLALGVAVAAASLWLMALLALWIVRPVAAHCHTGVGLLADAREPTETALCQRIAGLEARLAEEVAARHATQARLDRAQRMQALGQLASGIAHDFNNVLQAIGGALYLISKQPDDAARVARFAALAEDAAFRGAAITGRLLSLSRRDGLCAGPVSPAPLLSSMKELLSHTLDANIAISAEAGLGLPPLLADRGQLETVLINLATNARDAMPGGGVLTLSAALDGDMGGSEQALAPGRYIQIAVADTGEGMEAATLARATEAFFTTKEAGRGTGLGLAMALSFAERSGGAMRISSAPGQGTTVRIWLPCAAASPELPASVPTLRSARVPGPALPVGDAALALTESVH